MVACEPTMVEQGPDMATSITVMQGSDSRETLLATLPDEYRRWAEGIGPHANEASVRNVIGRA